MKILKYRRRRDAGKSLPVRSVRQWSVLALLVVATIACAYSAATNATANASRRRFPDLALSANPSEPVALTLKADLTFLKAKDPQSLMQVEKLARAALREQPASPGAIRLLGYLADMRAQPVRAAQLIRLSAKFSRRDFGAQWWLIEEAVAKDDKKKALKHYDIAMRGTLASHAVLFPTLTGALADPEVRAELARYVGERPSWLRPFLLEAISTSNNPANIVDLLLKSKRLPVSKEFAPIPDTLLTRLSDKSQFGAYQQYFLSLPGVRRETLTSVSFGPSTVNVPFPAAGWQLPDNAAVGGTFAKGSSGRFGLSAFAGSGERGVAAAKYLFLRSGRYRFNSVHSSETKPQNAELRWQLDCVSTIPHANIMLLSSPIELARQSIGVEFEVPANCSAQQLRLHLAGGSAQLGADIEVASVGITPI